MATVVAALSHGTRLESVRRGDAAVVDAGGALVAAGGEPTVGWDGRAVVGPFLAVPLVASGAAASFGLTTEEIAAACSAARPTPLHRALISSMLGKVRAGLEHDRPDLVASLDAVLAEVGDCSAELAGMIATCGHAGHDPAGVRSPGHPVRQAGHAVVSAALHGSATDRFPDADGRPRSHLASLRALASMYAVLADPQGACWEGEPSWRAAVAEIRRAILLHPDLVSDADAPDTTIICATDGWVLARMDPAGLLCLAIPERGLGIAIGDAGASPQCLASVGVGVLEELEIVNAVTVERMRRWLHLPKTRPLPGVILGAGVHAALARRTGD